MRLIARAQEWFGGLLSPEEDMEKFTVHVVGPSTVEQIVGFHSYACFYPDRQLYIAGGFKDEEKPAWRVDALKIREIIAGFNPSQGHVLHQRRLAEERMPRSSASERWLAANALSDICELPVMLVAFGHTQSDELVAYTASSVLAPLRKVASEMKRVAPQISMNSSVQ
jgi:hypothetical protein